jgi:SAM-dependent methyltransferase
MNRPANAAQTQRWNGESGRYWIVHRERHQAGHRQLVPHLFGAARISPGERVLDVGCGCGATTLAAASAAHGPAAGDTDGPAPDRREPGPGGIAVGLDLSGPMLGVARRLSVQAGSANARFVQGDAESCPLRHGSFDVMISSFGVMFFENPAAAFANIGAALRPGGRLAFLCWQPDLHNELFAIPLRAFGTHAQLPGSAPGELFADSGRVAELLSRTGWTDVEISAINEPAWIGSDVPDVMSYIRGMPSIRALIADLNDAALTKQVLASIAEEYAARLGPDGVWVRAAAWLVTAHRP